MKQKIKHAEIQPKNLKDLKVMIQHEWDSIDPDNFCHYLDSMPEHIEECHKRNSCSTGW